jgi:multiple antibiotic resistance protein
MDWTLTLKLFAALFAIMNPLSTIPVFLAMTADATDADRRKAMLSLIATVAIGSLIFAVAGQWLLSMFGIDVDHFRLAGGIIVLLLALNMLNGNDSSAHHGTEKEQQSYSAANNVGIYPVGVPISLGPGTIATIIVFSQSASAGFDARIAFYAGLFGYLVFFGALVLGAPMVARLMSPTALTISKRIMGMILAAIGVEMITGALTKIFPAWIG